MLITGTRIDVELEQSEEICEGQGSEVLLMMNYSQCRWAKLHFYHMYLTLNVLACPSSIG